MEISWDSSDDCSAAITTISERIQKRAIKRKELEERAAEFLKVAEKKKGEKGKRKNAKKRTIFGIVKHRWNLNGAKKGPKPPGV